MPDQDVQYLKDCQRHKSDGNTQHVPSHECVPARYMSPDSIPHSCSQQLMTAEKGLVRQPAHRDDAKDEEKRQRRSYLSTPISMSTMRVEEI